MEASQGYHTLKSFDSMLESGPLIRPTSSTQEEESEDEGSHMTVIRGPIDYIIHITLCI